MEDSLDSLLLTVLSCVYHVSAQNTVSISSSLVTTTENLRPKRPKHSQAALLLAVPVRICSSGPQPTSFHIGSYRRALLARVLLCGTADWLTRLSIARLPGNPDHLLLSGVTILVSHHCSAAAVLSPATIQIRIKVTFLSLFPANLQIQLFDAARENKGTSRIMLQRNSKRYISNWTHFNQQIHVDIQFVGYVLMKFIINTLRK